MNAVERSSASLARGRASKMVILLGSSAISLGLLSSQAALVDKWEAQTLVDLGVVDGGEAWFWPSQNEVDAFIAELPAPVLHANATPAGGPVLRFTNSILDVDGIGNPVQDLTEFTLSYVVKVNAASSRPGGAHWRSKTGIIDASEPEAAADWGTALTDDGNIGFGVGQPDTTLYTSAASVVDERFHVVVVTWKAGEVQKVFLDNWDPVAADSSIPAAPRNAGRMTFGGPTDRTEADQMLAGDLAEIRFYDTVMTDAEALAEATDLAVIHGVQFTRLINSFTASANEISAADSLTLNWSVAPDAAVSIEPGIGDVGGITVEGVGSLEVTPVNDTLYSLIAIRDTTTNQAPIDVTVYHPAADSLLDSWDAASATAGAVDEWTSTEGRAAVLSADSLAPTAVPNATPGGTAALEFAGSRLDVSGADNPLSGLTEATIAYVFKINEEPTRNTSAQWWGKTGLIDATQAGSQNDWGCVLSETGQAGFGVGNPDNTVYSLGESLVDGQWHLAIQTWNSGHARLYVDDREVVRSSGLVGRSPREAGNLTFGGIAEPDAESLFSGQIAEIRFYGDGLSAAEVAKVQEELVAKHGLGGGEIPVDPFLIVDSGFTPEGHYYTTFESVAGVTYRLQRKASLTDPEWVEVASGVANSATMTLTDTQSTSRDGMYRVVADASGGGTEIDPFLVIASGFTPDDRFFVTFESVAGVTYRLQRKNGLTDAEWTDVATGTATGATLTLTDPLVAAGGFYRVVAEASGGTGTPFAIQSAGFSGANEFSITFEAAPGGVYDLLKKTGLAAAEWITAASGSATESELTLIDPNASDPNAFYRVARSR